MFWGTSVIGASDRMLTAGDIQFEPQQTKVVILTSSIAAMLAGDSLLQSEIMQRVQIEVNSQVATDPTKWLNLRDVAELYSRYYCEIRSERAEKEILVPLGLDSNTFISRQKEMDANLVQMLARELLNFSIPGPGVAALIVGVDITGAHIYRVENEKVHCHDHIGFAAIGIGWWHATSQMMFSGQTKHKDFPETLILVYHSKKRAEVAPGVGEATDMFMVGPKLGTYWPIPDNMINELDGIYSAQRESERAAESAARERTDIYVTTLTAPEPKEQVSIQTDIGGSTPTDKKETSAEP
jgi:hypothetical protein